MKQSAGKFSVSRRLASQGEAMLHFSCAAGALHFQDKKRCLRNHPQSGSTVLRFSSLCSILGIVFSVFVIIVVFICYNQILIFWAIKYNRMIYALFDILICRYFIPFFPRLSSFSPPTVSQFATAWQGSSSPYRKDPQS